MFANIFSSVFILVPFVIVKKKKTHKKLEVSKVGKWFKNYGIFIQWLGSDDNKFNGSICVEMERWPDSGNQHMNPVSTGGL